MKAPPPRSLARSIELTDFSPPRRSSSSNNSSFRRSTSLHIQRPAALEPVGDHPLAFSPTASPSSSQEEIYGRISEGAALRAKSTFDKLFAQVHKRKTNLGAEVSKPSDALDPLVPMQTDDSRHLHSPHDGAVS